MKGLFVFLRKDELYGFCAYGLHAQKHNKKRMIPNIKQSSTLPGLFQLPWFCAELSTSNESHCIREKSTSTVNNINEIHGFVDIEGNLNKRGYAEILAEGNTDLDLYFSKFSNPHHPLIRNDGLKQDREEDYNTFIVLCRVLIDKMVVLDGDVTLEDVEMAIESGHDAIYSRSR